MYIRIYVCIYIYMYIYRCIYTYVHKWNCASKRLHVSCKSDFDDSVSSITIVAWWANYQMTPHISW